LETLLDRCDVTPRAANHLLAQLVCMGSHTVTNLVSACGGQFKDWSADYRMYERNRVSPEALFAAVRSQLCERHGGDVVIALDDTRVRKSGKKTFGVKYTRDPLGPPFHVNFILAQRFVQTSMACQTREGHARMIPVDWVHAPMPRKPSRHASQEQWKHYGELSNQSCLARLAVNRMQHVRHWMNESGALERSLWCVVDGSFTNATVLKNLPERTVLVGRIRKDAKLYYLPEQQPVAQGRRRQYGVQAPTPEELRANDAIPWQRISVCAGGARRRLRVKKLGPLRWRTAGANLDLQLVVIAPIAYRTTPKGKTLYRQPAYLICTDPHATLTQIVQRYVWRWDIEVNFRDQKTVLGLGEAQVRTPQAIQNVNGLAVAAYAMLLTAAETCKQANLPFLHLPAPKWRRYKPKRVTTMDLIQNLRYELWAKAILFSDFHATPNNNTNPQKTTLSLQSATFYATRYS